MNGGDSGTGPEKAPARSTAWASLARWATAWVAFWDEREAPTVLALIRISLAAVVLVDLASAFGHGVVAWLWAPGEASGIALLDTVDAPLFYRIFPATSGSAVLLWLGLVLSALGVGLGCFTQGSALLYVCLSAQAALINAPADRAIDRAIRIMVLILAFSPAGQLWSVDAKRKTGSFRGDPGKAPAWSRYLILGQLVLIYWGASLAKSGTHWYPWGGYRALYYTLQDPIMAARDFRWLAQPIPYFVTQLATAATHLWELSAPLVLVAAFYRRTRARPGRLRSLFNRLPVRTAYVAFGVAFHVALGLSMRLGIFPWAMLACFPAFFDPGELERASARLGAWARARWARLPTDPGGSRA